MILCKEQQISPCDKAPVLETLNICRASFPVYYYDKTHNKCVDYVYGGCHATENLFGTLEDCEKQCVDFNLIGKKRSDESIASGSDSSSIASNNINSDSFTESNNLNNQTPNIIDDQELSGLLIKKSKSSGETHIEYNEKPNDPNVKNLLSFYFFQ